MGRGRELRRNVVSQFRIITKVALRSLGTEVLILEPCEMERRFHKEQCKKNTHYDEECVYEDTNQPFLLHDECVSTLYVQPCIAQCFFEMYGMFLYEHMFENPARQKVFPPQKLSGGRRIWVF